MRLRSDIDPRSHPQDRRSPIEFGVVSENFDLNTSFSSARRKEALLIALYRSLSRNKPSMSLPLLAWQEAFSAQADWKESVKCQSYHKTISSGISNGYYYDALAYKVTKTSSPVASCLI